MAQEIEKYRARLVMISMLGALEAHADRQPMDLGPERERRLLAALASEAGKPVQRDMVVKWIWDDPPKKFITDFHKLMANVRRRFKAMGIEDALISKDGLCTLNIEPHWVDVHRFRSLTKRAQTVAVKDEPQAAELFRGALRLCRGEPLAGLPGERIDRYRQVLKEELRGAELVFSELEIKLGRHDQQIPRLTALSTEHPGDEWVTWLLMHTQYRAGRLDKAQEAYGAVCEHLDREISGESLKALRDLSYRMALRDSDLDRPEAVRFPVGRPVVIASAAGSHDTADTAGEREQEAADVGPAQMSAKYHFGRIKASGATAIGDRPRAYGPVTRVHGADATSEDRVELGDPGVEDDTPPATNGKYHFGDLEISGPFAVGEDAEAHGSDHPRES